MSAKLTAKLLKSFLRQSDRGVMEPHFETVDVEVLGVVGRWAMVRHKGAMPFVAAFKDLKEIQ